MNFSRRTLAQEYQSQLESFMRMALKAQNQCRMTLETLATIKNPPVVHAKQANIAHGPQQINNGVIPSETAVAPAQETRNPPNELLEVKPHEQLDTRATRTTSGADQTMATVDQLYRTGDVPG